MIERVIESESDGSILENEFTISVENPHDNHEYDDNSENNYQENEDDADELKREDSLDKFKTATYETFLQSIVPDCLVECDKDEIRGCVSQGN